MILVDTSVWIDHLSAAVPEMIRILDDGHVLVHPFVRGELACGNLKNREEILRLLGNLPQAPIATHTQAMKFIERHALMGRGVGYIDIHLLISTTLAGMTRLWTRDKRLIAVAMELELAYVE
uniref:PIN domain-containing protein n=1 Tax=Candidatus Kentrum sp. DK TaxID=2126562 RepID=A0A450SJK4_9GAMM|nr:MAG: hypothetical protein BECKDK2373B_GA0170837_10439 [Candidatus Kentron sp. DK]VFJ57814.1 MAG: hypothetical protein BECKDK2373C_GA0170839_106123 [Candidatus Kentron sp. DK]